jgi:predicted methyltransferase
MKNLNIEVPAAIGLALDSPRRPDEDKDRDGLRRLGELMAFFGVQPGWHVADLMASRGYVVGALAEIVGDQGVVYAQNSKQLLARFKGEAPIPDRIERYGLANVIDVVAELEDLGLPKGQLDAVFSFMFYHDSVWVGTDRAAMNAAVFAALKPGGIFAVVDHHAAPGSGTSVAQTLHRIDRAVVVDEITAAGFELSEESDFLANPDDPRTAMIFDKSIKDRTSKFVLKFRKPV